ncbi:MAG TPA: MarR family transcriptional regulator [Chloroflexota bacterium]
MTAGRASWLASPPRTTGDAAALVALLPALGRLMGEAIQAGPDAERLTVAQYRFLVHLVEGDRMSGELARCLGITPSSVTTTVDVLVQRGFAERKGAPGDRRYIRVRATEGGRVVLAAAHARMLERAEEILERLPDAARQRLADGLGALARALARDEAGPKGRHDEGESDD